MKEFYILGLPIETELGLVRFLKVREYPEYFGDLRIMSLNKNSLIYSYSQMNKTGSFIRLIEEIKKCNSLLEIVASIPELSIAYSRIFSKVFIEETPNLTEENFEYYRKLVLQMNCVKEEIVNPNPEIQKAIERSKRVKSQESEPIQFADIVTSVAAFSALSYEKINELTLYQLYMTFYRIGHFKNYDTTALFATVTDKVKIENWSKSIDLFEEEKHAMTKDEVSKKSNQLFGK